MARPKKEIDIRMFENMCAMQCTKNEICSIFDIDEKTLTRWCKDTYDEGFSDIYKKKSKVGLMSLRRTQFKLAEKNTSMAIWLGKQYLGQRDNFPDEINFSKINEGISNISKLINSPVENRNEDNIDE